MNGFILFIAIICGLFSGFGTGIRYGFLDTDKNENDLMDTKLVKFYKNTLVSVLTTVLAFPVCIFIFLTYFPTNRILHQSGKHLLIIKFPRIAF